MIGSTRDARRAGIQVARSATTINVPAAAPNETGSVTPTPYTNPRSVRDTASAHRCLTTYPRDRAHRVTHDVAVITGTSLPCSRTAARTAAASHVS